MARGTTPEAHARPEAAQVSVVVPTRDRPQLLERAIEAVLAQDYPALELIIVDDGSGPETARIIAQAKEKDPRVRTVRHETGRGAAAARNTGARLARGDYLLFEDDDCEGESRRVSRLVESLEADPGAAYAYCRWRLKRKSDAVTLGFEGPWGISTPCALIRAGCFRDVGGFDPDLPRLQDFDLWTRLLARWEAVEVPEILFEMYRGGEGITASDERLLAAADHLLLKYRGGGLPAMHAAVMHRRLGGKLLLSGFKREGTSHFREAIRRCAWCLRSWLGLLAALAGPRFYRALVRMQFRVTHRDAGAAPSFFPIESRRAPEGQT